MWKTCVSSAPLCIKCGSLDVSQTYRPPRPVTGIVFTMKPPVESLKGRGYQSPHHDFWFLQSQWSHCASNKPLSLITTGRRDVCYPWWVSLSTFPRIHKSVRFNDNPKQESLSGLMITRSKNPFDPLSETKLHITSLPSDGTAMCGARSISTPVTLRGLPMIYMRPRDVRSMYIVKQETTI
jgi:hypothetical protein